MFEASMQHLRKAERVIPLGSQTFSKSQTQYPVGHAPLYALRGRGAYLWDLDGNKYIDLVSNLGSVTLGYSDESQNRRIRKQLRNSFGMSLPSPLESKVAEKIVHLVPSIEMVRFGKNGSDATSAAVRLSRAYTNRDRVVVCGYHGWQDWYIASTTRNKGVPKATRDLTLIFQYNDIESLVNLFQKYPKEIACVVLEPMNRVFPNEGFLNQVIAVCEKFDSICIFDETVTGFRFSHGGAQKVFDVVPHLTTLGKGIANGMPLSVVGGRRDIMMEMEEIFFSGTFGGELVSLAAADYVLDLHLEDKVAPELARIGKQLTEVIEKQLAMNGLPSTITLSGHDSWKFYNWHATGSFSSEEVKSFFLQECYREGLLIIGSNNVSLSFGNRVMKRVAEKLGNVLSKLRGAIDSNTLREKLEFEPLQPLMKIR